jgi:DNA repair exonuclease SbcCD nuclease subunit
VLGNTGNHDASAERGTAPATAAVHDPGRGVEFVTEPARVVHPVDGLAVHVVSHYGLARSERLAPEPEEGAVNVLTAHGAAVVPGHEVFRSADSPGEQLVDAELLADDRFDLVALGHYHGMDEVLPGVWYAGSAVRRGFSDPAGPRGWLLVTVLPDGRVEVERRTIAQRPQHDLPAIDARGLTGAEVEERVRAALAAVDVEGAIVRQVVTSCTTSVRRGVDLPALARLASRALVWMPDFRRPEPLEEAERTVEGASTSLTTAGSVDLASGYRGWVREHAAEVGLSAQLLPVVAERGAAHLRAAAGEARAVRAGEPAPPGEVHEAGEAGEVDLRDGAATGRARARLLAAAAAAPAGAAPGAGDDEREVPW